MITRYSALIRLRESAIVYNSSVLCRLVDDGYLPAMLGSLGHAGCQILSGMWDPDFIWNHSNRLESAIDQAVLIRNILQEEESLFFLEPFLMSSWLT
jgi:hypothetical protein